MSARPFSTTRFDTIRCLGYSGGKHRLYTRSPCIQVISYVASFTSRSSGDAADAANFSPKQNVLGTFEKSSARIPPAGVSTGIKTRRNFGYF